jgi:hypothetical protein
MAYKVVKYRLEADGTIPTWLKFGVPQSTGGMYAVADPDTASPQDWIMIGIADDGADISGAIAEISSKSDLQTYLTNSANANGWKDQDSDGNDITFDASAHATKVWNDLDTLNGG